MKKINQICLLLFYLALTTSSCKKKPSENPIEDLPPATQTGAETFGCLVNGVAFKPKGSNLGGPILKSFYQYLNSPTAQGFHFHIGASRNNGGDKGREYISINSINKTVEQGKTYVLENAQDNNQIYGTYGIIKNILSTEYTTKGIYKGEFYISKFDEVIQIVSGTFWFDAVNDMGEKVELREGRFDVHYTE